MDKDQSPKKNVSGKGLKFLRPHHIDMIDSALSSVGEYGEIHLIVEKGQLRFVVTQTSYDALKWRPGMVSGDVNHQGLDY